MVAAMHADTASTAYFDQPLLLTTLALTGLGVVMVFSSTVVDDRAMQSLQYAQLMRHLLHIGIGTVLLLLAAMIRLDWLQSCSWGLLLLGLGSLGLLFVPGLGVEVNGALRWLRIGGLQLQPSEFMKIAALIYFADYLARKQQQLHLFTVGVVNPGVVVVVIALLLLLEPDFGTTVVLATTVAGMMFMAGVRLRYFLVLAATTSAVMLAVLYMAPYRVARLLNYRDPWADPFGSGFQLVQALIAIGRGEWFGVGLGNSIQKLSYLPYPSSDFLIAVIGEELGTVGIFAVIALFCLLLLRTFQIAARALNQGCYFAGFAAQGIGLLLSLQAIIHLGVNIGLLPTKGLTLPLMSDGGSSILSSMAAVGLLLAIDRRTRPVAGDRVCAA